MQLHEEKDTVAFWLRLVNPIVSLIFYIFPTVPTLFLDYGEQPH